jgi:hypothetical protein
MQRVASGGHPEVITKDETKLAAWMSLPSTTFGNACCFAEVCFGSPT